MEETKVIYHLNDEDTPYLMKLPIAAHSITLGDLKNALGRPNYKYFFKSMDDDFGIVKEEIGDDETLLPCFNGRVVSWLVISDGSVSDTHSECAESAPGDVMKEKQANRSSPSFGTQDGADLDQYETVDPISNKRKDVHLDETRSVRDQHSRSQHLPPSNHDQRRSEHRRRPVFDPGASSVMSSDIETTSFIDSDDDDDDDASSRFTATTETTAASSKYGHLRQRRRKHRLPMMTHASSFSSVTDSTMSLNIVTVTLNLDVVKFLGISIVGQSNKGGDGGIYVGSIMKGGAVALDGRIEPGDMILEVNDISFENTNNDDAVRVLRDVVQKNGPVKLVVAKCWDPNPRGYFLAPPAQEPIRPIDPSAWVAHTEAVRSGSIGGGMYGIVGLPFSSGNSIGSSVAGSMPAFSELCLTVHTDLAVVAKAMTRPDSGLEVRDRMWLKITIPNAFIGSELIDWLLSNVKGLSDRREARKYTGNLLKMGHIRHTVNKLNFSEQCYYTIGDTIASDLSSLALDDIDSVSEVNRGHSTKPASSWVNQFATNPYGPSYMSQPLGYAPPPPYNLVTSDRSHSSGSNKPNETTHSGSGSSASGSGRSQGGHKMAPMMSGSELGDGLSVLSCRRHSPSEKSQMMLNPSHQQPFNLPVTHPYLTDDLEIIGDV